MTTSQLPQRTTPAATVARQPRALALLTALLMPVGPAAVAWIRMIYPGDAATALASPGTMTTVLWLGLVGTFTLVPGALAALSLLRPRTPRLWAWTGAFLVPGYLAMMTTGFFDTLWASAPAAGLTLAQVEALGAAVDQQAPPMVGLFVFVIGHVVGNVLLGIAAWRARLLPSWIALGLLVSQPLHVVSVVLAMPWLDLIAWGLTAVGMAFLALRYLREHTG